MNRNKQLAINMIAQIVAFVVNFAINFFLSPYVVENIGKTAYGFVGLANNFINYVTIVTIALNSMAGRFITISIHKEEYEETNKYFTSVVIANAFLAVVLTLASIFILFNLNRIVNVPDKILNDVTALWGLLFANFILSLVGNVFGVATFAKNKLYLNSIRGIESNFIKCAALIVAFYFFKPSVWYLGLATFLCGLYTMIFNLYYTKKLLPYVKIKKKYIDIYKVKELIASGIWNSVTKISGILSSGLDLLITNLFVGAEAMGIVSISKVLPVNILSVFGAISGVFMPQLTISYAKGDYTDIRKQLNSSMRLLGFFACIPVTCIYAYGKEFFSLWMPGENADLLYRLLIIPITASIFSLPLEPLWNIFSVTNKVKTSSVYLVINSAISLLITVILLKNTTDINMKLYFVVGISTVLSIIRSLFFLPIYGAKCLKFKWYVFYSVIIKNFLSVILTTVIGFIINYFIYIDNWFVFFFSVFVTAGFACIMNYFILLTTNERKVLINLIFKRRKKV